MRSYTYLIIALLGTISTYAQYEKKTTYAYAFIGEIKVDGHLDDTPWQSAPITTDFTELEPEPNTAPSQRTEVKILYNDKGLYVGAFMHDKNPELILKELSIRDQRGNTDWFGITLDTYQDGLNGFAFIITASGVQQDIKIAGGDEDNNWDAVWESAVQIHDKGWNAELFIPYSAIRFPNVDVQSWNLQLARELRRTREQFFWNPIDPNFEGFINQAGHLEGIKNIESPVRLSVTPYVTGYVLHTKTDGVNEQGTSYNAGMDLKYGINDAFTLDMTLVPDFGQVRSDNQVLNLSPFEVFFEENRQFFTEGLELFDRGDLFYTRRVGGRPIDFFRPFEELASDEVVIDNPTRIQLYNATKISGRTSKGTGIGIFNAVARESHATIENLLGEQRIVKTNPLTNYNVIVADQNLRNNSRVTLINTNVLRDGSYYDANVTAAFWDLRDNSQAYNFTGKYVTSHQFYTSDSNNSGHSYSLGLAKTSGVIKAQINYNEESDTYDTNDLGFLFSPNERSFGAGIAYNQPNPKNDRLQRYEYFINANYERLYAPNEFVNFGFTVGSFFLYKSRNAFGGNIRIEPYDSYDFFEPRDNFNSFLRFPKSASINGFFSSDYRKTFALDVSAFYRRIDHDDRYAYQISFLPRIRVNDKMSFFMDLNYNQISNDLGYVNQGLINESLEGVAQDDIMIGRRDLDIIENSIRAQYIFNDVQSLALRVRHYHARVIYNQFGVLDDDGNQAAISYDGLNDQAQPIFDQNFNAFNVDMDYRWRFAPGSDIIINLKSQISGVDDFYGRSYSENFTNLFDKNQDNSLSLRIVYFLDYLYLK